MRLIYGYAPQSGSLEERQSFYDELKGEWEMHSANGLVVRLGDCNRHVGRHMDGVHGVDGGHSVGQRNLE